MQTLMRHWILQHVIWVYTVCSGLSVWILTVNMVMTYATFDDPDHSECTNRSVCSHLCSMTGVYTKIPRPISGGENSVLSENMQSSLQSTLEEHVIWLYHFFFLFIHFFFNSQHYLTHLCQMVFYLHSSDLSISNIRGVWLVFIITTFYRNSCI